MPSAAGGSGSTAALEAAMVQVALRAQAAISSTRQASFPDTQSALPWAFIHRTPRDPIWILAMRCSRACV